MLPRPLRLFLPHLPFLCPMCRSLPPLTLRTFGADTRMQAVDLSGNRDLSPRFNARAADGMGITGRTLTGPALNGRGTPGQRSQRFYSVAGLSPILTIPTRPVLLLHGGAIKLTRAVLADGPSAFIGDDKA